MHDGAESDDADVAAFFDYAGFAERNGIVGRDIRTIVGLAVKMLVLKKHYGSSQRTAVRRSPATSRAVDG